MTWTYEPCKTPCNSSCTGKNIAVLLAWCHSVDRDGKSLGVYNRRRIRGSKSAWSLHACGRALDWAPTSAHHGDEMFDALVRGDVPQIQMVIYRQREWGGVHGPIVRATTRHDHDDHLHIEVRR